MTKRKRPSAPRRGVPDFEGGVVGAQHRDAVNVLTREIRGQKEAIFMPRGISRLGSDGFEIAHSLQHTTMEMRRLSEALEVLVNEARALGFSWASIGFCVGTTGEAARQRWGELDG